MKPLLPQAFGSLQGDGFCAKAILRVPSSWAASPDWMTARATCRGARLHRNRHLGASQRGGLITPDVGEVLPHRKRHLAWLQPGCTRWRHDGLHRNRHLGCHAGSAPEPRDAAASGFPCTETVTLGSLCAVMRVRGTFTSPSCTDTVTLYRGPASRNAASRRALAPAQKPSP